MAIIGRVTLVMAYANVALESAPMSSREKMPL